MQNCNDRKNISFFHFCSGLYICPGKHKRTRSIFHVTITRSIVVSVSCAGWESDGCCKEFGLTYSLSKNQPPLLTSNHSLTVKDLLLSNLGQTVRRIQLLCGRLLSVFRQLTEGSVDVKKLMFSKNMFGVISVWRRFIVERSSGSEQYKVHDRADICHLKQMKS